MLFVSLPAAGLMRLFDALCDQRDAVNVRAGDCECVRCATLRLKTNVLFNLGRELKERLQDALSVQFPRIKFAFDPVLREFWLMDRETGGQIDPNAFDEAPAAPVEEAPSAANVGDESSVAGDSRSESTRIRFAAQEEIIRAFEEDDRRPPPPPPAPLAANEPNPADKRREKRFHAALKRLGAFDAPLPVTKRRRRGD